LQNLAVGLVEKDIGLTRALLQEGLQWKPCNLSKPISSEEFAVIIVNKELDDKEKANLSDFLNKGGKALKDLETAGKLLDERSITRGFKAAGKCLPEQASAIDKGAVRNELAERLRQLFAEQRLPFVQKWFFPGTSKSVLSLHLDVDNADLEAVEEVLGNVKKAGLKATWFVNGKSCNTEPEIVKLLLREHQIVESHGWEHNVFESFEENNEHLQKSIAFLKENGAKAVKGFSSPNGHCSKGLASALEKQGIEYVVAFSLSFLDLPYSIAEHNTIVLGTHPICPGIMKTRDFNEEKMLEFYRETIDKCIQAELPCFFYGHPSKRLARYPKIAQFLAEQAKKKGIAIVSLQEYSNWWRKRQAKCFEAFFDGKNVEVKTANNEKAFSLRITKPNGKENIAELKQGKIDLGKGAWNPREQGNAEFTCDNISGPGVKHVAKKIAARAVGK